ncbi:MAG: hypothetical protein ACE5Z5_05810 [Candidatus Bathyarchaeia archaeon]
MFEHAESLPRNSRKPRIIVSRFGKVGEEEVRHAVGVMRECYDRLAPHDVILVDLYAFDRSSSFEAFLARESSEVGVATASFDGQFFAVHDAWRGTPRIVLCLERMRGLPEPVRDGGIRHEVGHSALHESLLYYLLSLPQAFVDLMERHILPPGYAENLLYLVSIAVKDYEVARLLHRKGYFKDQAAYAKHLLRVCETDTLSWQVAKGEPLAEILVLVSCLKSICCAIPFMVDNRWREEMRRSLEEGLAYLPEDSSTALLNLATKDFPALGPDTLENIDRMALIIKTELIEPILQRT